MKDKVIVITGASQGLGEKLAEVCYARGARVVLAARSPEPLAALAARLGDRALAVPTDVAKREDNIRLAARAIAAFGRLDAWVANAGRGISRLPSQGPVHPDPQRVQRIEGRGQLADGEPAHRAASRVPRHPREHRAARRRRDGLRREDLTRRSSRRPAIHSRHAIATTFVPDAPDWGTFNAQ